MTRVFAVFMMLLLGIPTTLAVAAQPGATPTAGPDLGVAENATIDCDELQVFGESIVQPELGEVVCGTLEVPENWLQPEGRTISISYVVLKSTGADPHPDPIVYLEGGPGGSALAGIDGYAEIFAPHRQARDIVLFDQRGTQFSSKLDCSMALADGALEDFDDWQDDDGADDAGEANEPVDLRPSYDAEGLMATARQETGDETAACVRDLLQQGIDLRQYNSVASARDTVALMQALGYEEFNLYGISYGTRLALVIMRDFPDAGVRSVVLDSTFPPEIKGFELFPTEAHEVLMQLFAGCSLDPACNAAYPNLKQRFKDLLQSLQAEPVSDGAGMTVTAADLVELMRAIPFNVEIAPLVPRLVHELERGDTTTFAYIVFAVLGVEDELSAEEADETGAPSASPAASDLLDEEPLVAYLDAIVELSISAPAPVTAQMPFLLAALAQLPPTRENLKSFVVTAFDGPLFRDVRDALLEMADTMPEEDLELIFEVISGNLADLQMLFSDMTDAQFNSVECNEEVPFESFANTVANTEALEIPEIAYDVPAFIAQIFAVCEQWPSGRALDIENMGVTSDVPTLILAGSFDFQTPVSWNKQAFVNLPNAYYSEFPMAGHGVILFSDCASDVTVDFVDDPTTEPDNSCKVDLKPRWVLPDEALSETEEAAA